MPSASGWLLPPWSSRPCKIYTAVKADDGIDTNSSSAHTECSSPITPRRSNRQSLRWSSTSHRSYTILLILLTVLGITEVGIIAQSLSTSRTSRPQVLLSPCGHSPTEARALGCHFDIMSFCWLPDKCYDTELSSTFDNLTQWEWFLDPNKTQPVAHEQVMAGEYMGLYVSWEYHLRHCTAMWRKLHRAVLGDGRVAVDSYIANYDHTRHCEQMLLGQRGLGLDEVNTVIVAKFPDCGIA